MKILLQDKKSGLYLKNFQHWVTDPGEALNFPGTKQALRLLNQYQLSNVQLVLTFENDGAFVPIPLDNRSVRVT